MLHSSKSTLIYVNTGYEVTVADRLEAGAGGLDAEAGGLDTKAGVEYWWIASLFI